MTRLENGLSICRTVQLSIVDTTYGRGKPVTLEAAPERRMPTAAYLEAILPGKKLEHVGSPEMAQLGQYAREPGASSLFFQAVHACFSEHYALTLRPEVLMHLIVNEIAVTVNRHPEAYRHLFTTEAEQQRIDVEHNGLVLGSQDSPWHEAIALFGPELAKKVPPGVMEHMLPAFSTHTQVTQAASLVAFMDAAQQFYDYHTHTRCGIPEIRLAGDPADYRKMLNAAATLSEVFRPHLGRYFDHLLPVLATLAQQAEGAPVDEEFWRSIYKYESHSGTARFNGWLSAFVNYVQTAPSSAYGSEPATSGAVVEKDEKSYDWAGKLGWGGGGLDHGSVPSQVATAPFTWHYLGKEIKMLFAGGPLGVEVRDGALMPTLSYAVLHAAE